jgi:hypothetical protein
MNTTATVLVLAALLTGCSGLDVKRDYDTSVDFQRIKTYAWQPSAETGTDNGQDNNSLIDARIRRAINTALTERRYDARPTASADCLVAYHYAVEKSPEPDNVRTGIGLGMGSGGMFGSLGFGMGSDRDDGEREVITIDVIDPHSGKLWWRGFVRQRVERTSDPNKAQARTNATVRVILSKFPPPLNRR